MNKKTALLISQDFVYPVDSGNKRKLNDLLMALDKLYNVKYGIIFRENIDIKWIKKFKSNFNNIDLIFIRKKRVNIIKNLINDIPFWGIWYFENSINRLVMDVIKKEKFDLLIADTIITSIYLRNYNLKKIAIINDSLSLMSRDIIINDIFPFFKRVKTLFRYFFARILEKDVVKRFNKIIVVSKIDMKYIDKLIHNNKISVIPISFEKNETVFVKHQVKSKRLVFWANLKSSELYYIKWFEKNVYNKLFLDIDLKVMGKKPEYLDSKIYTGYIKDRSEYFTSKTIFICPVFQTHGILLKLIDAINYELPIVATKESFSGMDFIDKSKVCIVKNKYSVNEWWQKINYVFENYEKVKKDIIFVKQQMLKKIAKNEIIKKYEKEFKGVL